MYADIQAKFRETAPFAILFQKIEQTGLNEDVKNLNLGGAITAVSYWPVTK
jgi:peptide/nickel transport system substrate-binding protein